MRDFPDRSAEQVPRVPAFYSPCWKVLASGLPSGWEWLHCTRLVEPAPVRGSWWHHSGSTLGQAFSHETQSCWAPGHLTSPKPISSNSPCGPTTPYCSPESSNSLSTPLGSVLSSQSAPSLNVCLGLCRRPGYPPHPLLPHCLD